MTVRGLFETHLTVADMPRSVAFYRGVVGLPVALEMPERGAAFLWLGPPGRAMPGLWTLGPACSSTRITAALTDGSRLLPKNSRGRRPLGGPGVEGQAGDD